MQQFVSIASYWARRPKMPSWTQNWLQRRRLRPKPEGNSTLPSLAHSRSWQTRHSESDWLQIDGAKANLSLSKSPFKNYRGRQDSSKFHPKYVEEINSNNLPEESV